MAGESPDKSEQQKSPGETASGERDPRLAVRGDTGSPAGDPERSVDQPTAVFKAPVRNDREGDARLRDAVAAWMTKADEPGKNDSAAPESGSRSDNGSDAGAESDAGSASGSTAKPVPGSGSDGASESRSEAGSGSDAASGSGSGSGGPVASEPAVSEPVEPEPTEPEPVDEEPVKPVAAEAAAADGEGEDDAPARPAGASREAAGTEPAPAPEPAEKPAQEPAEDARPAAPEEEPAPEGGRTPVDQPTAVFRAVQRKPVDQPTTALKAVTPKAPPAGAAGAAEPAAESPAERTSKFVPLRPDDVRPAAKKPEASAASPAPAPASPAAAPRTAAPASLTEPERTRQQPLPPRPPLDMLAELTNTPPPPETPVRTAVRRVKIWTPLVLLLAIVFAIVQLVRPLPAPTLTMTAESSFAFDGGKPSLPWPNEGQGYMSATGLGTVDSFGEQKPVPIGSVAKAMTAYVILKEHPLKKGSKGEMIEIDALAEKEGGYDAQNESTLNTVKAGDKISEYDALAAIMIPSANNIARLLARWDAGSEAAFVKKMNDTAKELGMKNTTYTDPSGLNHTTVSSAEDQVKLGEKLVEIPALVEITAMPSWVDPSGKKWRNYNDLVPYNGALGIKTGSTTKAGGNLLFAAHKKVGDTDQLIVGAVLAQYKTPILGSAIAASKEAMLATQELLESRTVVKKGDVVGHVDDGLGGTTPVVATKDVKVVGWSGLTVRLELGNGGRALPHSAPAGTQVGVLTVGEGASQVRVPVALKSAMAEPGLGNKLTRLG
ncbi:D-alanyl-D-alanine carboxypeptidase family protein [Streptomyces lavendulocolor]